MASHQPVTTTYGARSAAAPFTVTQHTTQVYTAGFRTMLVVPTEDIRHLPPSAAAAAHLVLCTHYRPEDPGSCRLGTRCKFVHADTRRAQRQDVHVNYAWRSVEDCKYERFPGGQMFRVAAPNSKVANDVMGSDMALCTRALTAKRRPLTHCAHYYFNRTCNLGAQCQFIHAVFIDPSASDGQRAPVPSQLGDGRELQLTKKQREARRRETAVATESVVPHASSASSVTTASPVALLCDPAVVAAAVAHTGSGSGEFRSLATAPTLASRPSPSSEPLTTATSTTSSSARRGHVAAGAVQSGALRSREFRSLATTPALASCPCAPLGSLTAPSTPVSTPFRGRSPVASHPTSKIDELTPCDSSPRGVGADRDSPSRASASCAASRYRNDPYKPPALF